MQRCCAHATIRKEKTETMLHHMSKNSMKKSFKNRKSNSGSSFTMLSTGCLPHSYPDFVLLT